MSKKKTDALFVVEQLLKEELTETKDSGDIFFLKKWEEIFERIINKIIEENKKNDNN